jgi:urate oxidase
MHLAKHCHGKSRVRVARVWRDAGGQQHVVEWVVNVLLESAMAQAYLAGDNSGMTATDTVKNTARGAWLARQSPDPSCHSRKAAHARPCQQVYHVAKLQKQRCSADAFAVALAEHFVATYPLARGHPRPCRRSSCSRRHVRAAARRRSPPRM